MRHSGRDLPPASCREFCKKSRRDLTPYIGESIAVKEKERSAAMTLPQEVYRFFERGDFLLFCRPLSCARFLSLSIKAVLRASSCARSSIEADDKLPEIGRASCR